MHKILGYLLLLAGLFLIFFACIGMYKTFVLRAPVPGLIKMPPITAQTKQGFVTIPPDGINALANAALFAVLMLFLASAGGKTAGVGVNLLKAERIYDALVQLDLTKKEDLETLKKL